MAMIDDGFEALLEPFYNGKRLTDPISTKEDKYQLLPAFLKVKGASRPSPRSCSSLFAHAVLMMVLTACPTCRFGQAVCLAYTILRCLSLLLPCKPANHERVRLDTSTLTTSSSTMRSKRSSRQTARSTAKSRAASTWSSPISGSGGQLGPTTVTSRRGMMLRPWSVGCVT